MANVDTWRAWFILFYGGTGALSLGILFLYLYTWSWYQDHSERTTMLVKCAGFMGLTIFLIHANFVHSMESVPVDAWGIALSICVINAGWLMRILHILDKIKSYNGPPSSLTS